jgi:hypothetical protein
MESYTHGLARRTLGSEPAPNQAEMGFTQLGQTQSEAEQAQKNVPSMFGGGNKPPRGSKRKNKETVQGENKKQKIVRRRGVIDDLDGWVF